MNSLTATIGDALAVHLVDFTFEKARSRLVRQSSVGWQAIVIEALPTATQGVSKLAAHAQVRIDALEALYAPLHPFLDKKALKQHPTLVANCDGLISLQSLAHGFPSDAAGVQKFVVAYADAVRTDVVPWLERCSREDEILKGLSDPDPKKWVISDRLVRYPVLLAILARRGEWEWFERIATEFSAYCNQRHALVYRPLADAMLELRVRARK
jgi:hypothetical protein